MARQGAWSIDGYMVDDSGSLLMSTYVDLRSEDVRWSQIPMLIKGCKQEHALETTETVLISKPARFRDYGEDDSLIRDALEGLATKEFIETVSETPAEVARRKAFLDQSESLEILDSGLRMTRNESSESTQKEVASLSYANDWWVFSTSIRPDDEEWNSWKATLPREYDHVSEIGQPAKFAEALARMALEQIGPTGERAWATHSFDGEIQGRTEHGSIWVIHGPVVYVDDPYEVLKHEGKGIHKLAPMIFTKHTKYAAQREYRFAILNGGSKDETVFLKVSGMMRDALTPTDQGLVRYAPVPDTARDIDESNSNPPRQGSSGPISARITRREGKTIRETKRWETKDQDGQVISSDTDERESAVESTVTHEVDPTEDGVLQTVFQSGQREKQERFQEWRPRSDKSTGIEEDIVATKEIALEEGDWQQARDPHESGPVVHGGTGRTYGSFEEMFNDPASPLKPMRQTWHEKTTTPEEIVRTFRVLESLQSKMDKVAYEHRQDIASAGWYVTQCVRNIYAQLGDVVESLWIERERFVVIRLTEPPNSTATARIVIAPTGVYSYCFWSAKQSVTGFGGVEWGTQFFPLGNTIETFESYGWPSKEGHTDLQESDDELNANETAPWEGRQE